MQSVQSSTVMGRARNFKTVQYLLVHGTADGEELPELTLTHFCSHMVLYSHVNPLLSLTLSLAPYLSLPFMNPNTQ